MSTHTKLIRAYDSNILNSDHGKITSNASDVGPNVEYSEL